MDVWRRAWIKWKIPILQWRTHCCRRVFFFFFPEVLIKDRPGWWVNRRSEFNHTYSQGFTPKLLGAAVPVSLPTANHTNKQNKRTELDSPGFRRAPTRFLHQCKEGRKMEDGRFSSLHADFNLSSSTWKSLWCETVKKFYDHYFFCTHTHTHKHTHIVVLLFLWGHSYLTLLLTN